MQEVQFGQYALPVIITVILAFVYKSFDNPDGSSSIPNRSKPLIAISIGIGLGIVGLFYNAVEASFKNIVDHVLYGFMTGASAVGIWEGIRATVNKPK